MSSANKAKGTRYEALVADYLQEQGIRAKRLPRAGAKDIGDIAFPITDGTIVMEAKARKEMSLSTYVEEAAVESVNYEVRYPAEAPAFGVAVVKRRMKAVGDSYVVMSLDEFVEILKHLGA